MNIKKYTFGMCKFKFLKSNSREDLGFLVMAVMGIGLPVLSLIKNLKNAELNDM